jgi:hypothetical protein
MPATASTLPILNASLRSNSPLSVVHERAINTPALVSSETGSCKVTRDVDNDVSAATAGTNVEVSEEEL